MVQQDPSANVGRLSLFYEGNKKVAGLDNIQFLSRDVLLAVEDAGDTLHMQRKALDSGYAFDVTVDYSNRDNQPIRWLAEGRDPSATLDSAGGRSRHNDGLNRISGGRNFGMEMLTLTNLCAERLHLLPELGRGASPLHQSVKQNSEGAPPS